MNASMKMGLQAFITVSRSGGFHHDPFSPYVASNRILWKLENNLPAGGRLSALQCFINRPAQLRFRMNPNHPAVFRAFIK